MASIPVTTQFVDTFIDHSVLPAVEHPNERTARAYAAELTARRQGEVHVHLGTGREVVYENGVEVVADSATA